MCGIFGVFGHPEAARLTYLGLYALQHRGQESAGVVSTDGQNLYSESGMGLVANVFNEKRLKRLPGQSAIGHVRYSTAGGSRMCNIQPLLADTWRGQIAVAHNGNLVAVQRLRQKLEREGAIFQSSSDTECFLHLLARNSRDSTSQALCAALQEVRGAYSLLFLTADRGYAVRDPFGFRPLCVGRLGQALVLSSETCAFDLIGAEYRFDLCPGGIIQIPVAESIQYLRLDRPKAPVSAHCVFEHVYFARPDSHLFGRSVYESRVEMGRRLAREALVPADVIVPVPDSGNAAAEGYAEESGIRFALGLTRNHYLGRTFIEPKQSIRDFSARLKFNPVGSVMRGRKVVLVDDSIVRATASPRIVRMVRAAGADEVHVRISSPPFVARCHYGIDTPTDAELVARRKTVEDIRRIINADSLAFLSLEGLHASVGDGGWCDACFTLRYPVPVE